LDELKKRMMAKCHLHITSPFTAIPHLAVWATAGKEVER
jgi:hypothetical protein